MKTVSLKTTLLAAALSLSSIFVNGLGNVMAQNAKDWYAPQSITTLDKATYKDVLIFQIGKYRLITTLDKATYKEVTRSFRKKNSVKLAFHFEKCQWNIQRSASYEFLKDSVNLHDLMSEFEDVVVSKSGISKCEITPPLTIYTR